MIKTFLGLFLFIVIICTSVAENKWCKTDCTGKIGPHILCHSTHKVVSKKCGKVLQSGLTQQDKRKILDLHNSLRQKVASGNEKRGNPGPQPKAENMPKLVWDSQLEEIAQAWANECNYGHRCAHLGDSFTDHVGQNIGMFWSEPAAEFEEIVQEWYDEVAHFNKDQVKRYVPSKKNEPAIGHYTQMVWSKTTKVGCGGMKYIEEGDDMEITYLVCNYHRAGNVLETAVY